MLRPAGLALIPLVLGCGPRDEPEAELAFEVAPNPHDPFGALVDLALDEEAEVWAEVRDGTSRVQRSREVLVQPGEPAQLWIRGLAAETSVDVRVVAENDRQWSSEWMAYDNGPAPEGFPAPEILSTETFDPDEVVCTDGRRGTGPVGVPVWYCVDRKGTPRLSLEHPDGLPLLTVTPLADGGFAAVNDSSPSLLSLFEPTGELAQDLEPSWFDARGRFRHLWIDPHEVIEVHEGPWAGAIVVLTGVQDETPVGPRLGYGLAVLDPETMELLWDWNSHGALGDDLPIDPKLPYDRVHPLEDAADWQHANAVVHGLDEDGGPFFWMSLRHQDWVLKIDAETDQVVWRFGEGGDFTLVDDLDAVDPQPLTPDHWPFHQHALQLLPMDGDRVGLVLFDNGNLRRASDGSWDYDAEPYSRLVAFELDERTLQAAPIAVVGGPGQFFSAIRGDADRLPDGRLQYLVSWPGRPQVVTVDGDSGEEIWRMSLHPEGGPYRAPTWPSVYAPAFY